MSSKQSKQTPRSSTKNVAAAWQYKRGKAFVIVGLLLVLAGWGAYLLNRSDAAIDTTNPIADTNGDNMVTIFDLSYTLSKWNTNDSTADFTGDGAVNIFDLSRLLGQWGRDDSSAQHGPDLSSLINPAGLSTYNQFENLSAAQVDRLGGGNYGAFYNDALTAHRYIADDNGSSPQGQFRLICTASHFAYDDPIIFPDQPGKAHLHMFWGNTRASAYTNFTQGDSNNLLESGSSTCQGGALNRSAYWVPAMLAGGVSTNRKVVVPKTITLYYKSHRPREAQSLPQGIQLIVGNIAPGGVPGTSFSANENLSWGCYDPSRGLSVNQTTTIPGTNGSAQCPYNWDIQATIQFPQCIAANGGQPVLTSPDFVSHTTTVNPNNPCPGSHPYRVPQISYLIRWANPSGTSEASWRLSSDQGASLQTGQVPHPGGSLHGDWLGGWYDGAIEAWMDGCFRTVFSSGTGRNCSIGQTGQNGTSRSFKRYSGTHTNGLGLDYNGPQLLTDPAPFYAPH